MTLKTTGKRELIEPHKGESVSCARDKGQFSESDDVGRSLAQDQRRQAKTVAKKGQGDGRPQDALGLRPALPTGGDGSRSRRC